MKIITLLLLVFISSCNVENEKELSTETAFLCGGLKTFISTTKMVFFSMQMVPMKKELLPTTISNLKIIAHLQTDLLANKFNLKNKSTELKTFLSKLNDIHERTKELDLKDLKILKEEMNSYIRFLDSIYNDHCGRVQVSIEFGK